MKSLDILAQRKIDGNYRSLKVLEGGVDFSSNDILGLAKSPHLTAKILEEWLSIKAGVKNGAGGSRLLTGNTAFAETLESSIASFHGFKSGVLFNCGFMANLGLIKAVTTAQDALFFDAQIHASTKSGIKLSDVKAYPFRHNDMEHLETRLKRCSCKGERYICVESIYSTDGSLAPLNELISLARRFDARLIVDEAHAVGVYGPQGKGLVEAGGYQEAIFAKVATFGKALGVQGAIILGEPSLKERVVNVATSFIYTTALPPWALCAIKGSYALFPAMQKEREQVVLLRRYLQNSTHKSAVTHIFPFYMKSNECAKKVANRLADEGITLLPLLSPTVRKGEENLRLTVHAYNTQKELAFVIKEVNTHG